MCKSSALDEWGSPLSSWSAKPDGKKQLVNDFSLVHATVGEERVYIFVRRRSYSHGRNSTAAEQLMTILPGHRAPLRSLRHEKYALESKETCQTRSRPEKTVLSDGSTIEHDG